MANIRDIARYAEVSVATVSRSLAKPELVKPATLAKINAAIAALNYTPNAMASSLRRKRNDTLLVAVPDIHNPFYSEIVQGIENVAHARGLHILLGETKYEQARLDGYAAMLSRKQADGLILIGTLMPTGFDAPDSDRHLVLACEYLERMSLPSVRIDNVKAAREAVSYLAALGHRRIATLTGPITSRLGRDRVQGYRDALVDAGIAYDEMLVSVGDFSLASGMEGMQQLLLLRNGPTAVFCASDEMAIGAIRALTLAGRRVPDDCSLIGFDDSRFAPYMSPPLTTVAQPAVAIGETAIGLMLKALDGRSDGEEVVLPHRLVVRESTSALSH